MSEAGRVGAAARMLGYAGLLPPLFTTGVLGVMRLSGGSIPDGSTLGPVVGLAVAYPLVILSFLGGMWWSFAMRRDGGQASLAALAVLPSLVALTLLVGMAATLLIGWSLVATGTAVILTLFVDRHLVNTGEAPDGWMRLRIPLSLGLGGLTILAGALIGNPTTVY